MTPTPPRGPAAPALPWSARLDLAAWLRTEPELRLLPLLCQRDRAFVDIGASRGVYARAALPLAGRVIAVEPLPLRVDALRRAFGGRLDVVEAAVSDRAGTAVLHVPRVGEHVVDTRASLSAQANPGLATTPLEVRLTRLDELGLPPVSGLKLDVEGHELEALRGSEALLERDRPAVLVEVEERHRTGAVAETSAWMLAHGYRGWFLDGRTLRPLAEFELERDQHPDAAKRPGRRRRGRYINNFLFVAPSR
jgi:FkbM family methyltransferase